MVLYSGHCQLGMIHFIGIGGIGISGIAEILHNLGYNIQGSDIVNNLNTKRLVKLGIKVIIGHQEKNISSASYIVISSAIDNSNCELVAARQKKIPILKRAEMLAELMRFKYSIAVSGSHGKTTTTSMIAHIFEYYNQEPTVINGGILYNRNTNAYLGTGHYLIAETDESDGTFMQIYSNIAVVTNIDREHIGFYQGFDNLKKAFIEFINRLSFYGFAVVCHDDKEVRQITSRIQNKEILTYGTKGDKLNIVAKNIILKEFSSSFDIEINLPLLEKKIIDNIEIGVPGIHNVLNSLAAFLIAAKLGFDTSLFNKALKNYKAVNRRFTKLGEYRKVLIIDDYAHHPVEIKTSLQPARLIAKQRGGNLIVIFQPHRYSRTLELMDDFHKCFDDADKVFVSNIFAAGEKNISNITPNDIVNGIKSYSKRIHTESFDYTNNTLKYILKNHTKSGDVVIFMGAGSITKWANNLFT